ncbi:hypothetical protein [Catonella massiliensis]|jgi:hypothetical protein|uniref:Lipoprotein n=1 Tax=Catonella massiliensis TaxID=2799636 RepID=A0ABS1J018_9FIRM|nr:hypothetical protein [Catonella massiliensis]MBK5897471.1 hypothetical protein [Catonella massiliensis]
MKYRYLPATIMLSAGAITIFICIYNRYETLRSLEILLAVLIIFLIIGSLTKKALIKIINMENDKTANANANANAKEQAETEENKEEEKADNEDEGNQAN